MIKIEEIVPRKLSGVTSLLISFNYNAAIIDNLKTFPTYYYHKKDYTWELPINDLSNLLDKLSTIDDIQLVLLAEQNLEEPKYLSDEEISQFRYKPFPHQLDAINFAIKKHKFLLLDDMGLGKTNEMIWTAETLKRRGIIEHCLIVCGVNSLKQNWKKK